MFVRGHGKAQTPSQRTDLMIDIKFIKWVKTGDKSKMSDMW